MTKPWNELSDADRARLLRFIDSGGQDLGLGDLDQAAAGPDGERLRTAAEQFLRAMVRRYEGAIGREIEATVVGELLTALARVLELVAADDEGSYEPMHHHDDPNHPNADPFLVDRMMRLLKVGNRSLAQQVETLHALAQRNAALIVAHEPPRILTLPLRDVTVMPGETEIVEALPTALTVLGRLLLADECMGCMVEELQIGNESILRDVLPCSAAVFVQASLPLGKVEQIDRLGVGHYRLTFEKAANRVVSAPGRPRTTVIEVVQRLRDRVAELLPKQGLARPGVSIALRIRNITQYPVKVSGAFFGHAAS